jgi:hypothetical protein
VEALGEIAVYYPVASRITPVATIRRQRLLPVAGDVIVEPGDAVEPSDVVARCQLPGALQVVDVSRALGVPRGEAEKWMRKKAGDAVQTDDPIAVRQGLFGRVKSRCHAPVAGRVAAVHDGLALLEAAPANFTLRAFIRGWVDSIAPGRGAIISSVGTLVQGAWGSGGIAVGVLRVLADDPYTVLSDRHLDARCRGAFVVAGQILHEDVLCRAAKLGIAGLIAGSASADLYPQLQMQPFPVLITEGFGPLPLSRLALSLLQWNDGREAMLCSESRTVRGATRPEVMIPSDQKDPPLPDEDDPIALKVGMEVRGLRAPHLGAMGTVAGLPAQPGLVQSGAWLPVAEVKLSATGETESIPLANLERID